MTPARRQAVATMALGILLPTAGAAIALAWTAGMWASLTGAALIVVWIVGLACWSALRSERAAREDGAADEVVPLGLLLDQVPVPLLRVALGQAHAINRAARTLFATDDRILPPPPALLDRGTQRLRQAGRSWRIDAVETTRAGRLIALIDIDAAERAAEDRAGDEMIDILGHELLNGLSPIVSLADSAVTAAAQGDAMLGEILATLARRVEGLEGFTRAYRDLARLPDPVPAPMSLRELSDDLARLFAGRFGDVVLSIDVGEEVVHADRAQLMQAIWALLQNAAEAARAAPAPATVGLTILRDGDAVIVEIADSGAGVPAPDRATVFRPFHTTKPDGSGIGLTLARRIVRAHGGDLTLAPTMPTTFRLRLPLRP